MTASEAPDWAAIRYRYEETQDAVARICAESGVAERELAARRRKEGWRRKSPRPFPPPRATRPATRQPATSARTGEAGGGASREALSSEGRPDALGGDSVSPKGAAAPPSIPRRLLATPAARRRLLDRLCAAISMKLEQLERRMANDLARNDDTPATDHERETRAIGALIDNLEKITEMEAGLGKSAAKPGAAPTDLADEADRCRRELAERLHRIVSAAAARA
ncbi:MAG: hypothetical protein AB7O57_21195 [Hyphomicrobiaceae bacterium]